MWSKDRITILKSHIVLVGMPGSGKSLTGKKLASRLNVPFFDTDTEIEKRVNMSIPNIFKYKGESFFRNYEEKIIKELLLKDVYSVISTGGGAFVSKISRYRIKSKAITV